MPMNERILTAGGPGSGKTYGWLTIAKMLKNSTFHVIDPDDGVERVWRPEFPEVTNIDYYFTPFWRADLKLYSKNCWQGGVADAFGQVKKRVKPEDWVVVEMLDNLWNMAQGYFVTSVFNQDIGEYFLQARKVMSAKDKNLEALDGWKDWSVIKKLHNDDFVNQVCYQLPVHVYMTTSASVTSGREAMKEDDEIRALYKDTLIRIDGEKRNPFRAQTILLFSGDAKRGFTVTTFLKDRGGRRWLERVPNNNFAMQYLVAVAGWKMPG